MVDLRNKLKVKGLPSDDEHCVIYAMFPQQLEELYKKPEPKAETPVQAATKPAPAPAASATAGTGAINAQIRGNAKNCAMNLNIEGKQHAIQIQEL